MEILDIVVRIAAEFLFAIWLGMQVVYVKGFIKYNKELMEIKKRLIMLDKILDMEIEKMQNEG